jgi:hypothetical protein
MALVVESTSVNSGSGTTLVITKPTGLAVGDLMIAVLGCYGGIAQTIDTLSGWTLIANRAFSNGSVNMQYKIADAGDVAASNFTFTDTASSSIFSGSIMRVSGHASVGFLDASDSDDYNSTAKTSISFTTTVSPTYNNSLIVLCFGAGNNGGAGAGTIGSYVVSDGTLSWTELYDYSVDIGSIDPILGGAYGIQATAVALTTYGATLSLTKEAQGGIIAVFRAKVDATGTNATFAVSPLLSTQNGVAGGQGTNATFAVSPTLFNQSGRATTPTQWTNPDKPSTIWTNSNKI